MAFLSSFFEHLRYFTMAARRLGAEGQFQLGSMNAQVRVGARQVEFLAQYLSRRPDGSLTYAMEFAADAPGFVGWLPYFNKRWVEAYDKLAFRQRCRTAGLPLPRSTTTLAHTDLGDFVIKRSRGSSFGQGVHGPFAAHTAATLSLEPGDYAEEYLQGEVGKAWYWNDRVVAIELQPPATVVGDGVASVGELVRRGRRSADLSHQTEFLRFCGVTWADVPARGQTVQVDFKYGSPYEMFQVKSMNRMDELKDSAVVARLNRWGPVFWGFVPQPIRQGTLYTVDFIACQGQGNGNGADLRLLEMNCNPMVPPEIYDVILADVFAPEGRVAGVAAPQPPVVQAIATLPHVPAPMPAPAPAVTISPGTVAP